MTFKLPDSYYEKQREIYDKKYIKFNEEEIHITDFEDRSITPEMQDQMWMNSYARDDLPPKLTDEALIKTVEYYLTNTAQRNFPCITYEETIIHRLVPELIQRLKEKI